MKSNIDPIFYDIPPSDEKPGDVSLPCGCVLRKLPDRRHPEVLMRVIRRLALRQAEDRLVDGLIELWTDDAMEEIESEGAK